jgi:predicted transposase YbfD/YdcC
MSDGGKGSSPRPFSVSQETYGNNFDAIFRKPSVKEIEDDKAEQEEFDRIKRQNALDKLAKIQQDMGLYGDEYNPLVKD